MRRHTISTTYNSSSLADYKIAGCNIPGMYTKLPVGVGPATGNGTHVDRGTALRPYSAQYGDVILQLSVIAAILSIGLVTAELV